MEYINITENPGVETFAYALFPVFLFEAIRDYEMLNIWGIDINFVVLHIILAIL